MSTMAAAGRLARIWQAPIGKKAVMAATGVVLFGFVLGHMLGNLQIYLGREKIDAYGRFLHETPSLLWGTRIVLAVSVLLHIVSAVQLTSLSKTARPQAYRRHEPIRSTTAGRTMLLTGLVVAAFVVYHLLHFTFGTVHPSFEPLAVYDNVVAGFREVSVSAAYIVAMVLLGMHLNHGLWSMFQSLGLSHPRYTPILKRGAAVFAIAIVLGNVSIPIAVMAGLIG